jgi:hypothetical protein
MSYSIIKDYTNKKGKTHQAHFSPSGKYLGPVSKKGTEPMFLSRAKPQTFTSDINGSNSSTKPISEMTLQEATELSRAIQCCPHLFEQTMVSLLHLHIYSLESELQEVEQPQSVNHTQ